MNSHAWRSMVILLCTGIQLLACGQVGFKSEGSASQSTGSGGLAGQFQTLKPTLAVRGAKCTMCHADISSGVITDFGYGNSYFLGAGLDAEAYEIAGTWNFPKIRGVLTVPKATYSGSQSLADRIREYNSITGLTSVVEKNSIHIGAPSAEQILAAAQGRANTFSPLARKGGYFQLSENFTCEGDVVVDGILFLKGAKIQTTRGCRIYATASVFIEGAPQLIGAFDDRNLQIVSSRAVLMGLGRCGSFDSVTNRFKQRGSFVTRGGLSASDSAAQIIADSQKISDLLDIDCSAYGASQSFERILINAPQIHSRYLGKFKGTAIAEIAIFKLEDLVFEYDPVFERVPALSLTGPDLSLKIE